MSFIKKNNEKKTKWWKTNEQAEFKNFAGANYRVASGIMVLFMIGLIILGLAAVVHSTKPSENPATFKSLLWIGASFVFVSIFGLFVNIILQFSRVKKNINKDKKLKEYNEKLALREEAFNKSRRERIGISNAEKEDNKKTKKH